ncbi:MAG TPA: cell envelope integrity protein CreD [Bacteroidales bacterium]|nr:cell envelope integrity protein CreD [Bacteroidales bacterium]
MTEKTLSFYEKNIVVFKVGAIGFLILLLLIPMSMIDSLVMERKARQMEAANEISSKWGFEQKLTGPVLAVPYMLIEPGQKQGEVITSAHTAYFLPEMLKVDGKINPEVRNRGLFKVAVYSSTLKVEGNFKAPIFNQGNKQIVINWKEAYITIGIPDLRGIRENINFNWNDKSMTCEPGVKSNEIVESGVTVNNILTEAPNEADYKFSFDIALNGSRGISFIPVGKETNVSIASTWANPSFDGSFLPYERHISEKGFDAKWKVLELNRNYPQKWVDDKVNLESSAFGVSLLLPIETYQITERSMKYAILFIALTFMTFFFVEVLRKMRVHPIQYVLVGFGLLLFYLLLLSLSEQMSFNMAYLIATIGIVTMITSYSYSIFKNTRLTTILSSILILLYGFLFVLLQLQDYALLMGSIGLFLILSSVMYLSRKINWYAINGGKADNEITNTRE